LRTALTIVQQQDRIRASCNAVILALAAYARLEFKALFR
jgi:hypothetical protein